jgi:GNAT superfamily N-acetyltransferase
MIVRPARPEDAVRIADIHVAAWQKAYPGLVPESLLASVNRPAREISWTRALSSGKTRILVAEHDGRIQGWSQFGASRDPNADPSVGEVYGMYVDPVAWRTGVGSALWKATHEELKATFSHATLWVIEANRSARDFYERCGFVVEPTSVDKPDWLGVNRIRYRRPLNVSNRDDR